MKRRKPFWRRLNALAGFFWIVSQLPAEAPPSHGLPAAVWDAARSLPPPAWFGPVQSFAAAQTTVWRAAVRPPPGLSHLAATFVFTETSSGVARVIWQGPGRSVVLCSNLFEGAAPLHRRTLLIERQTLGGPGQLLVESTGMSPVLLRVELSWVEPLVFAASGWTPPGWYLAPSGKIFPADELQGQGPGLPQDESRGPMVDAVLDPGPVRCEPGHPVRFLSGMAAAPAHGRLQAQVAGLAPDEEPEIWVNGLRLPAVAVELAGLDDAGHRGSAGQWIFAGWRTVVAAVPPGWLRQGENRVDWVCPSGAVGMTLRHLRLQVSYPTETAGVPPAVASPAEAAADAALAPAPKLRLGLSSPTRGLSLRSE